LPYKANYFAQNGGLVGSIKRPLYKDHRLNHSKAAILESGSLPPALPGTKGIYPKKKVHA
jgi:hypothetical protein